MTLFLAGLCLGLLLQRHAVKPLIAWNLRCWYLGHVPSKFDGACKRCRLYGIHDPCDKFTQTFWS